MKAVRGRLSSLLVDFFFGLRDLGPEVIGGRGALVRHTWSKHGHEYCGKQRKNTPQKCISLYNGRSIRSEFNSATLLVRKASLTKKK